MDLLNRMNDRIKTAVAASMLVTTILPISVAHAEQIQAPIAGWSARDYVFTNASDVPGLYCTGEGVSAGRTEVVRGSPPTRIQYWCIRPSAVPGEFFEQSSFNQIANWKTACQGGYSETDVYYDGDRRIIGSCVKSGFVPAQPEVCCESDGNPVMISSRRKIQTEVDYSGSGSFPLSFVRTYANATPGRSPSFLASPVVNVWRHSYDKRLVGSVSGSAQVTTYQQIGNHYYPEPPASGGAPGIDFSAIRPDGTSIFFTDLNAAPNQTIYLVRATTPSGDPGFLLKKSDDEEEIYDEFGILVAVRSRSGEMHQLNYDPATGYLISVNDDYGKKLSFEYSEGKLSAMIDPSGGRVTYTYNEEGDYETATYPSTGSYTSVRTYLYESDARLLTGIRNERGARYTSWQYKLTAEDYGLAAESTGPDGIDQVRFEKHSGDDVMTTDSLGRQIIYQFSDIAGGKLLTSKQRLATATTKAATESRSYDSEGFLTSLSDWNGNTTLYEPDIRGLPLSQTMAAGTSNERVITREWHPDFRLPLSETYPDYRVDYQRDARGNVLTQTKTDAATGESRVWSYSYDAFGKLLTIDGPRNDVSDIITLNYYNCSTGGQCGQLSQSTDPLGFVTQFTDYNAHGQLTRSVDANGTARTYTYNARRWLTSYTIGLSATTALTYDEVGNVIRVTLPDGTFTQYSWDVVNRLVGVSDGAGNSIGWTLDTAGNRTKEIYSDPGNSMRFSQSRAYDALSRLIETGYNHGGRDRYEYDPNGNSTKVIDSANREDVNTYDALDRLTVLRDALQGDTRLVYDTQDNIVSVTDPEGQATTYTYNGFGDRLSQISQDSGTTTYSVDAAGNRTSQTDARGVTRTTSYDALDRPVSVNFPDAGETIRYVYDQGVNGIGRLSGITDESGSTEFEYDDRGNITRTVNTVDAQSYSISYSYNAADRLTGVNYPSGRSLVYTYDGSGRVDSVTSTDSTGTVEVLAAGIERLPFGPMQSLTLGNSIERTHSYDLDYRLESLTDTGVLERNYAWNSVNNITAITDGLNIDGSQLFNYDALDRLSFAIGGYGERSFTYDAVGNRQSIQRNDDSGLTMNN